MKRTFLAITFVLLYTISFSQIKVGTWRDHFSFESIISAYQMSDGQVVASSANGLMYIDTDGGLSKLTKANGLYDVGISATEFFKDLNIIILGYDNGNIDIVTEDNIYNLSDIKRKNISGDKKIYSFTRSGNFAYASCGFGIVKIDVVNAEIVDTYYIGNNAKYVKVNKVAILNDSIFAATDEGIYKANLNDFLSDYNNWTTENITKYTIFKDVVLGGSNLFFLAKDSSSSQTVLLKRSSTLEVINPTLNENAKLFGLNNLYVTSYRNIYVYNFSGTLLQSINKLADNSDIRPEYIDVKNNGELIVSDYYSGVYIQNGNNFNNYILQGVAFNQAKKVVAKNNFIVITRGGFSGTGTNLWQTATVNIYKNQQWTYFYEIGNNDFYSIVLDPNKEGHYYIGSWGYGVFEYQDDKLLNKYDYTNSPLESVIANAPYLRISAMQLDDENNLWIFNRAKNNPLNILKPDGTWVSYSLNGLISDEFTRDMQLTENSMLWATAKGRGFIILDYNNTIDNTGDDIQRVYYPYDEEGERIGSDVLCFEEDNIGNIWFGTDDGVGAIYSPRNFNDANFTASRIKITAELGDSLTTNYLLKGEKILSMAIDGGNRKWFGTESSGIYLLNSSGSVQLLHFDADNSPLPSNKIISIAIEPTSGEVFIITAKGVVSYRGDATIADNKFKNVYVFPNPVRPDYTGNITITGLAANVNVKITDIAGNLVYETTANGGQATWNGNNLDGIRAATGVYLVFCSNDDASETFVTKLLFIN